MTQQASKQCGAPSASSLWSSINWQQVEEDVFRFQMRIAKATKAQRWNKVRVLQRLLTRSHQAKLLAVKRVTSNWGRSTPGIDGTRWINPQQKWHAAMSLSCRGYRAQPLRRIHIPKKNGKTKPLGSPAVSDRIAQMVVKQILEPVLEPLFHTDSYGYRPGKSAHQAIAQARKRCWKFDWVVEVDIKGFFDNIDHDLLLKAVRHHTQERWVVMYIERWLKAPVQMPDGAMLVRDRGTPQGGVISPLISNLFLHYAFDMWMKRQFPGVPFERYADDVVCRCHSQWQAEALISELRQRLAQCGLELHPQKTRIVYCKDADRRGNYAETSFDFLGYTFRPRLSMNRWGNTFVNFSPAMSARAGKAIRQEVRCWGGVCKIAVTSPCTIWRICSMRKSEAG